MDMDLQIKVAQAVHVLNHDTESCNRVAANQWLVQFQQTDAAWEVATSILTSDRPSFLADFEVEFFAAQILKRKVGSRVWILSFLLLIFLFSSFLLRNGARFCCEGTQIYYLKIWVKLKTSRFMCFWAYSSTFAYTSSFFVLLITIGKKQF